MDSKKHIYQIKLEGHIHLNLSDSFENAVVKYTDDGRTILVGALPDQTALHGILMRIRDLGISLVEVKRIEHPSNYD